MSHFIRSLTPHRPAEGRGRSGLIHVTTVSVERFPYQDVMKLSAFSKRRSDTVDPPLFLVLSTGDMKRLHKVIGDLLTSPLANRQSSQTEEEIVALGLIRTQSDVTISVEKPMIGTLLWGAYWNRELSPAEVLAFYHARIGLIEEKESDDGSRQTSEDDTGKGSTNDPDEGAAAGVSSESGAGETGCAHSAIDCTHEPCPGSRIDPG